MEDERRQKNLDAGREKLAAYQYMKKKNLSSHQSEQKKKKRVENEAEETSIGEDSPSSLENSERIELDVSARSNGASFASEEGKFGSEDAGELSTDRLQSRVKELEDILSGKEAALEAAHEELSALKEISSLDVSSGMLESDYKIHLEEYHKRLQGFQDAVQDRERIIGQLSNSLQQAIKTRDALQLQGEHLAQEVALLQRQLKATTESIQSHQWDTGIQPHDYLALQNQMLALEAAVSKNESTIDDLRNVIKAKDSQLQGKSEELEKKTQDLSHHKTKSANEIQKLMRDVEELHQKCAMQSSNHNSLLLEHQEEMASLQSQLEENFGLQLVQIKEELRNQFSLEKQSMKENHAAEINSCQALIAKLTASSSKADAEVTSIDLEQLQMELQETSESKLLLEKQIEQLKESYDSEVFSLKENITRLQTELEESEKVKQNLEQQIVDTEKKYEKEFMSHKEQVEDLNFKFQESRKAETSYFTQLRECEAELASCQQSHEMELASCRQRVEALNQRLQEASEAEENFPKVLAAHKQSLESELSRHKEEIVALKTALDSLKSSNEILQKEKTELLDSHGIAISSYEQQLLALKTSLHTSESFESEFSRYKEEYNALNSEVQTLKSSQEISEKEKAQLIETHNSAIASYEQQILILRKSLHTGEETVESHRNELADLKYQLQENNKNIEAYVNEVGVYKEQVSVLSSHLEKALKVGESLQQEFCQCKENHGKEISLLTEKFELELNARASNASQSQETELALCKQQIEFLNSRLQDSNDAEKCHVSEITACQVQLKEYKNQVESLDRRFNEELLRAQENFSKELSVKDQEIEVLKVQLGEASKLEEVHKSDFSYKSQIESLNRQLLQRDETEKRYVDEVKSYQEKLILYTDQINHLKSFADSQNELQIYKEQMETMKESFQCELSKLTSLHEAEMKALQERHEMETQSLKNQLEIFNQQLADVLQLVESIEEKETYSEENLSEISSCDHRIEKMKSKLQQFIKLKDIYEADILRSKEQLTSQEAISHSLNAELAKLANEVLREKETHAKEISDLKEAVEQVKNDKIKVETNLNDVIKQRDEFGDSNRAQLEEVMVQYLKLQSLLTAKEEVENSLENQIKDLQVELRGANDQAKTENSNFQEITVQYLKLEGLLSAKEETLQMLAERNRYLEETMAAISKNSEDRNKECSQLTQKIAKAKELLRRLKAEKDVVSEKCEQLEMDKEQLISEKAQNEEKLKELTYQIEHMKTHTKTDDTANKTDLIPSKETSLAKVVAQLEGSVTTVPGSNFCNENTVITIEDINDAEPHIPESGPLKRRKRDVTDSNAPCQSSLPHKWVEKLITLEGEKIKLENNLVMVESKLQEKEAVEQMYKEDKEKALAYCRELEERLQVLGGVKVELSTAQHIKQELELKITNLTNEIRTFQMKQENLNQESMEEKFHREDKTHQELKEKFDNIRDEQNNGSCEQLILDLSKTSKEVVFLKEKLRIQEQSNQTLCSKILELEKSKEMSEKKVESCYSELTRVHAELEESWIKLNCSKEELGTVKKEITILQLQKERLEASRNKWNGQDDITPVFVASLRGVVEELAAEVEALKSSLDCEQRRNEKLAMELAVARKNGSTDVNSNDSSNGMLELQNKLELILKSNAELVAEKEALLDKLRGQQQFISNLQMDGGGEELGSWITNLDKQQNDLLAELRAYREQHTSLAELVGSTGVLQETLYRQKQELLHKFEAIVEELKDSITREIYSISEAELTRVKENSLKKGTSVVRIQEENISNISCDKEKTEIEKLLERERTELKSAHLKIQMMELQLLEKDKISQELARQKRLLEEDLHEIEDRLKDQENQLESQKLALEAEIHARDLHIKHWQLELKRKQVEGSTEIAMKTLEQQTKNKETDEQQKLELLRSQLDDMHLQAVARLKHHLEEQFAVRETELQRNFSSELATLEQQHKEQLLDLQTKLDHKVKEIEKLLDTELMHQLGISNDMATRLQVEDIIHIKEQLEREVEELKNNLDAEQKEMYSIMRGKFEKYGDQQIALAIKLLKEEHSTVQQQEINSLIIKHTEELKTLHLKLESQRQEELLALRQELNKKHKDDLNEATKGLKLEFAILKEPFDRLSKENILQLKDKASVEYTVSINNCVQSWYTECQEHIENLNKQIEYVFEGQQNVEVQGDVEKLLETKEQYLTQVDDLQTEIAKHYVQSLQNLESLFDVEQEKLIGKIEEMKKTFEEGATVASMQNQIKELEEEKEELNKKHRLAVDLLSQEKQLANLRDELEAKHAKEMEELRQYFEQKCLEVEKHYSEEVFSQQSRKMSGSSSETEELVSDMYYAGGDHGQRLTALTHICDSYTVEPSYKDLEEHYRTDFEKRLLEYREQLDTVKVELEQKYNSEMELMREEYETKVAELVRDLSNTHKAEIQNLESKHAKEILNLKEKFHAEAAAELSTVKLECSQEIEKTRKEMAETHQEELMRLKNTYEEELKLKIENLTKQMKQEEECHLEAMKSKLLNKHVRDIQNMEDTFADHVVEEIGKTTTDSALQKVDLEHKVQSDLKGLEEEHQKKIKEMEEKHAKDLEAERKLLGEQFDEIANMLKKSAEEEQEKFMLNQKEMMSELLKQHQKDFQVLKCQHEEKTQQMKGKYEHKIKLLKDELAKYIKHKDTCLVQPEYMAAASQVQLSACRNTSEDETIQQLKEEIKEKDAKLAELKTLHESELEQLRIRCDGQLHDEVEQAKHDIVRALEEQIQALLANDSEDSPRPPELVELQEKFAARYKQQLEELKERHTRELERLKQESDSELQSLSEKYSLLEEQHQDYLDQEMALLTQKVELSFTNTGTFIDSTVRELRSLKHQIRELEKTKHAMQVKLGEATEEGEKDSITVLHADLEQLIKERDGLKKMTDTLRYLLGELVAYFTVCEDELNNTLIGELLRCEAEISLDAADTSKNNSTLVDQAVPPIPQDVSGRNSEANSIKTGDTFSIESPLISPGEDISLVHEQAPHDNVSAAAQHLEKSLVTTSTNNSARRVHFAPDASGIISLIEGDRLMECIQKNKDVSTDFRCELENCLERLKHEAVTVLGLSGALPKTVQLTREAVAVLEDKVNILTKRLEEEVKTKDELLVQVDKAEERETELVELQEHVDALELELRLARASIAELERELGKREDVSEGFGESIQPGLNKRLQNMAQLQDKARTVLSEKADDLQKSPHLQLIEELCHEGDRLSEEARKEREDLQQQIDAADKQLRATRQFLEDQAAEREQERDDFLREIAKLQEQIRERDRDRAEHQQLSKEVEVLEQQVKEAASLQKDSDAKKEELETELKAAVDKIWVLRDIIGELENQVETKTKHEELLEQQLRELHAILEQQSKNHQELAEELDSLRLDSGKSELTDHINHLEEQLRKHRLHVEQFQANSTAVKQMKAQLRDLEAAVDKKTKDLESLHTNVSSASCSSPSEDVSIREQLDALRCETPESQTQSPVCLPLDDLHRLQDKLQRHTRAEEVALKRIRDLEMQLKAVKRSEEEVTAERDVLQERMEEQLFKISTLQSRLDEQRLKTDSLQKEAYLELQAKVRDQEIEINELREIVETKEKEFQKAKSNMEKTKKIMAAHEQEWSMCSREVKEIKEKLRRICLEHNLDTSILQPHIIMPTYIASKEFVLREQLGAPSKRVEGQLKRYASVMDRRIWSNDQEENRQYFLEYIRAMPDDQADGSLGRIIPIEAVIELLMGKKDVMIDDLKSQLADCKDGKPEDLSGVKPEVRSGGPDPGGKLIITPGEDELLFTSDRNVGETESELDMDESNLKWMLVQKDSEILSLKHKLAACQIDLDDKDLYLIEAMKKLEHAYDIIEENRDILEELEKSNMKIKTLQGEKENLSKERKDAVALVQKLELENKDLKKKRGFATPESKKLQEELDSNRAKVKELENQEKDLLKGNESQMLLLEVENLKNTLGKYADLEKKLLELMKKAGRCDEMVEKLRAAGIDPDFSGATSGEGLKGLSPDGQAKKIDELQKALDACRAGKDANNDDLGVKKKIDDACKEEQEAMNERGVTFKNGSVPGGKSLDECVEELEKMRAALAGKTPSELLNELEQVRKDKKEQDADCEALKKERDMLKRERDAVMEERNALRFQASQCISKLGALQAENAALKMELEQLRSQGGSCQVMEQKLNALRRERDASKQRVNELGSALQDLQHKNGNLSNVVAERDMLRMKLNDFAGLEQELERMRYRVKEAEVLRTERDRMKMRLDELECIEDAYHALLNETRNMEVIAAERDMYKTKYEEIACLESEVECLKNCVGQLQRAECERDQLKRKVKDLQCAIADQEDENKHLRVTLDHLSFGPDEQQARVEQGIAELRSELKEKEKKLSECECQLANLQIMQAEKEALEEKLRASVMTTETVRKTCEEKCRCLEASEAELQRQLNENEQKLVKQNQEISTMQTDISKKDEMMKKLSKDRDDSLLQMANEVEALKAKIKGLQENVEELEGLRIELVDCKEENSKLIKDAEELRLKLMTVVEENKILQEENATLTGSCSGVCLLTIEELTNENKNLKHDLACRNELLEKLKKECDEKDADVSKLNQHMSHLEVERNREQKLREHCTCQLAAVNAAKMKLVKKLECAEDNLASAKKWKVQLKVEQKEKMSNQAETGALQEPLKNELDEEKRIRRALENKLEELQNKFQTSKENVNDLHSHVEIIFQTRSALEVQLKSLNTELIGLKDELLQYREHCEQEKKHILKTFNIEQSCKSLQEKINQLKEGLEKADAEKSKLSEKLDTYEYQFTAHDDETQHLCGKSEVLEDKVRLESSQVAIEEINNLRQKSSELKPENALLKEKLRKQRNSIEVSKSVSSVFVKEEFCCKKEKSSILPPKTEESFSAQEGFSNDKEEKMVDDEGIPEETSCLRQQSNDKINSSSLFEDEVRNLRQKSSELQAENEELRNKLATQQEVAKNEIKFRFSRQNEINNLKLKSSELEMQNSKLKVKVAEQQKFIQKQEAENSENLLQWSESIDRLQKQVSEIKTSHDSLESQLQEKCKVKDKQEDIIQRMDREIKDLIVKLTEAQKLEYLLIDEQEKNKVKVNEISKMKIRNEELTAKLEELKTKYADSSEELNNLRLESNASKMKLKDLSSYVKKVTEKNEELKSSLNEAEKKLSEMSHTVAALEKEREESKICYESAYEDVNKCKQMIKELDREVKKLSNVSCPKCQAFLQEKKLQLESDQEFSELGKRLTENLDGAEHLNQENVKHEIEKDVISKHYTKSNEKLLDLHAKDKNELMSRSELESYAGNFVNEIIVEGKQSVLEINLSKKLGKSMNHSAPKTNTEDKLDNELQWVKESSNQKIRDLTNQVEQEIRKIKQNHVEEIQCLQAEHEKKLQKLNERFQNDRQRAASVGMGVERQIPDRRRLSCSKTEIYSFEPSKRPVPVEKRIDLTGPPKDGKESKTNEIVSKVLQEGIMALDFEDLSYLHQQICSATCSALMKTDPSKHGYNINQYECKCGLQVDDPVLLQKRICSLEDEIAQKEKENERQVLQLESSIRRERRHIEDLKEKLSMEQQKTMELHNRLKLHSRGLSDVQVERDLYQKQLAFHEDRVREFIVMLEQERARVRQYEDEIAKERNNVKNLQSLLDAERHRARCAKLQDSEFIENLRIKLETAMANENKLRLQIEQEKLVRDSAEKLEECTSPKGRCPAFPSNGKLELEQERCAKLELELRREQRRAEELVSAVEKERQLGLQKIEIEKELVHQLKRELLSLEGQRDNLNSQLMHVREQLGVRSVETEALERKVRVLQEAEVRRQRKRLSEQEELDRNRRDLQKAQSLQYDLEQKIIDLEQEVARLRQQLLDRKLHASGEILRQEVEKLKLDLEENIRERSPSPKLSSPVLEKLKNVNVMLEQHVSENAEVALTLSRLTEERQQLQSRIRDLEAKLRAASKERGTDELVSTERALWAQEKAALKVALAQAEADALRGGCRTGDGTDMEERVKHLFGKYLRAESYRKALVWQKRYLLVVLGGYQESEAITVSRLAQLSGIQEAMVHHTHSSSVSHRKPRTRFRTAAIVVIALSRMRFMVRRWRLGRRIGSGAVLSRGYSESALSSTQSSYHGPRRRGSSTSMHSLGGLRGPTHANNRFGLLSPPSRDQPTVRRWQTDFVVQHHMRSTENIPVTSIRPSHVSEYVDRLDELQRRLGLGISSPPS